MPRNNQGSTDVCFLTSLRNILWMKCIPVLKNIKNGLLILRIKYVCQEIVKYHGDVIIYCYIF